MIQLKLKHLYKTLIFQCDINFYYNLNIYYLIWLLILYKKLKQNNLHKKEAFIRYLFDR